MPWKESSVTEQRRALVEAVLAGTESIGVVSKRFGVSRQTAHKFLRRWKRDGPAGLVDHSRRPRGVKSWGWNWMARLAAARRRHPTWGARKLRWLLVQRWPGRVPGVRTLHRWLKRLGLTKRRKSLRRRIVLNGAVQPTPAIHSNDVWTFDHKGWFPTRDGHKVEPLTVRDLASRYVLWTRPLRARNERAIRSLCVRLFKRYGCPRVIRCDLGAPFFGDGPHGFTRLSLWWWRLGIAVEFVRRGVINNNAHEQMHGVLHREVPIAANLPAQRQALERWRRLYNERRPHESLQLTPPARIYQPQPAPLPHLRPPRYPSGWITRRVQRNGEVCLPRWRGTIGRAFAGLTVGFQRSGNGRFAAYFDRLLLGHLDFARSRKLLLTVAR